MKKITAAVLAALLLLAGCGGGDPEPADGCTEYSGADNGREHAAVKKICH
jgi:ABC-type glycerol-3-phosphate transport system substrate-binding protein